VEFFEGRSDSLRAFQASGEAMSSEHFPCVGRVRVLGFEAGTGKRFRAERIGKFEERELLVSWEEVGVLHGCSLSGVGPLFAQGVGSTFPDTVQKWIANGRVTAIEE
jgi:hypothetical protein